MNKISIIFFFLFSLVLNAQVGIGTTNPDSSAALEISSSSSGLLIPKMTMAQRNSILSPAIGLMIYQTDNSPGFYFYDSTNNWTPISNGSSNNTNWIISNNDIYNSNTGNVGIGTTSPTTKLHIEDTSGGNILINQDFENGLSPFTTGGNANWYIQNTIVNNGTSAAVSGNISDSETSYMEFNVTIPSSGANLSFFYSVSSENGWDFLRFYIDGVQQNEWSGNINFTQQTYPLSSGSHVLKWSYEKDSSFDGGNDEVYIDDVIITTISSVFRLVDGTQSNGFVLTSDANGNASWSDPTGSTGDDGDWSISGTNMSNSNTGQVLISNSLAGSSILSVENLTSSLTAGSYGIHGITHSVDLIGSSGVMGESVAAGSHEIGVMGDYAFWGNALVGIGWGTSVNDIPNTGSSSGETNDIGVFGSVNYSTGIGVYGLNYDTTGYAGYFDGNLTMVNGTKNASVPTSKGNQLLYSMESPEVWFEDFGQANLKNGFAHIILDEMFQETVRIDNEHPMHVFLQEQGECNGLYFIADPDGKGFIVKEKQKGNSNITFSYRITAKRRFFQDHRFGVDPLQPFGNNLLNANYVKPRTISTEDMKVIIYNASNDKNSKNSSIHNNKKSENSEKKS